MRSHVGIGLSRLIRSVAFLALLGEVAVVPSSAAELDAAQRYRERVQPILESYCYGCHGYGASEGGRVLDELSSDEELLANVDVWLAVLNNVRADIMPPADLDRPTEQERRELFGWIKQAVFGIDPDNPDPGRVTLRRLNRVEYRNTIRDLMGVEYDTDTNFPADDTGYGFDNIGDALSMSPLLMEKYIAAAEEIVAEAVPTVSRVVPERVVEGRRFRSQDGAVDGRELSFYDAAQVTSAIQVDKPAKYRIVVEAQIDGYWEGDPGRARVTCEFLGQQRFEQEYDWRDKLDVRFEIDEALSAGEHPLTFKLEPLVPVEEKRNWLHFRIDRVRVFGPLDDSAWVPPPNYERFFPFGRPPETEPEKSDYARETLRAFVRRAFRRPADETTIDRLVALAQHVYNQPGKSFEEGIAQAMIAVLASPRFLFRIEEPMPMPAGESHPLVDEYSLASRLSYFLWSTMPDDELLRLAGEGRVRENLDAQVERMLADRRSGALVSNFTGQWLQARDVESISIDAVAALGYQKEFESLMEEFRRARRQGRRRGEAGRRPRDAEAENQTPEEAEAEARRQELFQKFRRFGELRERFSGDVRRAMRRETEMTFEHIMREDRSVLEFIDSDYTFLNQKLAEYYDIPGVEGDRMRRVELPEGSWRGGVLTQGTLLVVTSNPTRTSPVKRGLFVLDNILGTPAPPPVENVPPLELSVTEATTDQEPTLREALELHRSDPRCADCHARMDPLGLALENFNAIGMWRDLEHGQVIDATGTLITGESFQDIRELKKLLKDERRLDFYRCLTEKLLTYALGRGLEYTDTHTVDTIVERLEAEDGRFSVLLGGIIESPPFQKTRFRE